MTSRIVPSHIREYIDSALENMATAEGRGRPFSLDARSQPGLIQTLAAFLGELDEAILPGDPAGYLKFVAARETIQSCARTAESGQQAILDKVVGYGKQNPVAIIRELLEHCPDDAVPKSTAELAFVSDEAYRDSLRSDLSSVEAFLNGRMWKAAMVIGGSLAEALLHHQLSQRSSDALRKLDEMKQQHEIGSQVPKDIDYWHLKEYVKVAHRIGMISERTKELCLLASEYRNLIHPGKAVRENAQCTRGAAFGVFGAVLEVIHDLTR